MSHTKDTDTTDTDRSWGISNHLPSNHVRVHYHGIPELKDIVNSVHDALETNGDGNQYILILGLPENMRNRFLDEDRPVAISVRLALDGTSAILKVPTAQHEICTTELMYEIRANCSSMGVPSADIMVGGTTTHKMPGGQRAKEPDQCLWPAGRKPHAGRPQGWPTLVIETGTAKSLPRLQQDIRWWFENSLGETRIVLVMSIHRASRSIMIQRWQLAPPGTPPLTRLDQMRTQPPPRVQQAANLQRPCIAQHVEINPGRISGAPLVLDFHAVLDRPPRGNEADIVIPADILLHCTRSV